MQTIRRGVTHGQRGQPYLQLEGLAQCQSLSRLFAHGPRHKYVDIVTDTLHASSSDLITWNTLIMLKMNWVGILSQDSGSRLLPSLEAWTLRDEESPFRPDNRRGFARVTPLALSNSGIPNTEIYALDEFPLHGLGLHDDYEPWSQYCLAEWICTRSTRIPSDQLDQRLRGSLPPLAFMVSRPQQPIAAGEELLCRFDAAVRPYWLRDWQSGFGGYTKVYEYTVNGTMRRRYSIIFCGTRGPS